ncbi:MAG: CAP domain-containing protein [Erythrobacter sp.]|uniref:CAP domain-containing protein n=1 Tax=Erythrobacter sp. TaxID=1042 RepID=UPI0032646DED
MAFALGLGGKADARSDLSQEQSAWFNAHNEARDAFGTAPLEWSERLTMEAQQWADQLARENTIRHSNPDIRARTGENLWMGTSGYFHPSQMIGFFVDEQRYFRSGRFPNVSRTGNWADVGHYTQIVWAETREVGCAKATNGQNDVLVCRYYPGGNVLGQMIAPQRKIARR